MTPALSVPAVCEAQPINNTLRELLPVIPSNVSYGLKRIWKKTKQRSGWLTLVCWEYKLVGTWHLLLCHIYFGQSCIECVLEGLFCQACCCWRCVQGRSNNCVSRHFTLWEMIRNHTRIFIFNINVHFLFQSWNCSALNLLQHVQTDSVCWTWGLSRV